MKRLTWKKRGIALLIAGCLLVAWGLWHFNDPLVRGFRWGMPMPQKAQYLALVAGAMCIVGGVTYLRQKPLP